MSIASKLVGRNWFPSLLRHSVESVTMLSFKSTIWRQIRLLDGSSALTTDLEDAEGDLFLVVLASFLLYLYGKT